MGTAAYLVTAEQRCYLAFVRPTLLQDQWQMQGYMEAHIPHCHMQAIAQFRLRVARLQVNLLKSSTSQEFQYCRHCGTSELDDEWHAFLHCSATSHLWRDWPAFYDQYDMLAHIYQAPPCEFGPVASQLINILETWEA